MRIIPAIDVIDGKCVRLTQGNYDQKTIYNADPVEVALNFENAGLRYLHLVDLDGAKAGRVINWKVIEKICQTTSLIVDFGGGVKTSEELSRLFDSGIQQVNLGSIAVKHPELVYTWLEQYGPDRIILSADVKDQMIAIHGWQQTSQLHINEFVAGYVQRGLRYVVCTDISTDGMLTGPNVELYASLMNKFPDIRLIASGGVSCKADLINLKKMNLEGVIVGKAIYEGRVILTELSSI